MVGLPSVHVNPTCHPSAQRTHKTHTLCTVAGLAVAKVGINKCVQISDTVVCPPGLEEVEQEDEGDRSEIKRRDDDETHRVVQLMSQVHVISSANTGGATALRFEEYMADLKVESQRGSSRSILALRQWQWGGGGAFAAATATVGVITLTMTIISEDDIISGARQNAERKTKDERGARE